MIRDYVIHWKDNFTQGYYRSHYTGTDEQLENMYVDFINKGRKIIEIEPIL